MKARSLCFMPLLFVATAHSDDPAALQRIEKAIEAARKATFVPGTSLAVVKDDRVILLKGFGQRDVAKRLPVTPDTQFCIGSSTKAFTALLVALSAEEGKLALTDHPSKYIPDFRLKDEDANKRIQIMDLLTHRSGLPRTDLAWYTGKFSRDEVIQMIPEFEPTAKLGQKWQYQNVMFMVAGEVAAKANGTTYDEMLKQRIFAPLGMQRTTSTYEGWLNSEERAQGYGPSGPETAKNPLPYRSLNVAGPAGSINSSAKEMAQWLRLQLNKGTVDGKAVAKPETIEETHKPRIEMMAGSGSHYGFGWMLKKWNGINEVQHGGNIDGYHAMVSFLPEKNVGLVMLTNVSATPLTNQAIDIVYKELVGIPKEEPKPGATSEPEKTYQEASDEQMGSYYLEVAKVTLSFKKDKGKLILEQSGVKLPMKLTADKTYEPENEKAPKIKLIFQPSKKDPKDTELLLEQSGMKFTLERVPPYKGPMTGEELLAKVVEAQGGPEAIRKQRNMTGTFVSRMISEGITTRGYTWQADGNKQAQFGVMFALNRRFGWIHTFTDGKSAYSGTSFTQNSPSSGRALVDAVNSANIEMDLDPSKHYKSLEITGEEKVGDEEVFILKKTPIQGSPITESISKRTFLVVKRQMGPGYTLYEDYRDVEGLKIPFKQTTETPESGKSVTVFEEVSFNGHRPAWAFRWVPERG